MTRNRLLVTGSTTLGLLLAALAAPSPAVATHGAFPQSTGIYRIPYADGTTLTVTNDHHQHGGGNLPGDGNDRIDLVAGTPGATVVAAASGTIMAIVDIHGDSNNLGDGQDINGNSGALLGDGVTPHTDAAEHSCSDGSPAVANSIVIGICQRYNNYVWIAHPNGEWSKYTHLATGSVTGPPNNWSVGDTVLVGQALGIEADVGRATGAASCMGPPSTVGCATHLHHEIAFDPANPYPTDPTDPPPLSGPFVSAPGLPGGGSSPPGGGPASGYYAGGFLQDPADNVVPTVCDIANNLYADSTSSPGNDTYTANPCTNTAPTAAAGGPYSLAEGSTEELDGTASSDPENALLAYSWSPGTNLDDPTSATPTYSGVDDTVEVIQLTVSDLGGDVTPATALTDSDNATVTVTNVAPTVTAIGDAIDEGGTATVSATFNDPGTLDTHTASIDWDDGTPPEAVTPAQLGAGVTHVYGDNGAFDVAITVTDDDGGAGTDTVVVDVANLDPVLGLDVPGIISFPGGDYAVLDTGEELPASAEGTDPGSDDLTFTWSTGDAFTSFNAGETADPFPSPLGTFPFAAADAIDAGYASPGVELLTVTLTDDDGGSDNADAGVIVTGTATDTQGSGWWKHQYSGNGEPHVDAASAAGYLDIVNAVSSVFSESVTAATATDVHGLLSPSGGDRRAAATTALMEAWLQFASGAVAWDATVPLSDGTSVGFLELMSEAEATILDLGASNEQLLALEHDLNRVRHAG